MSMKLVKLLVGISIVLFMLKKILPSGSSSKSLGLKAVKNVKLGNPFAKKLPILGRKSSVKLGQKAMVKLGNPFAVKKVLTEVEV